MENSLSTFEKSGLKVEIDALKGRVVFSTRDFLPGDVIFEEKAFVFGSLKSSKDFEMQDYPLYFSTQNDPKAKLQQILEEMCAFEAIFLLDRARCVLKSIAKLEKKTQEVKKMLFENELTCANYEKCLETAAVLVKTIFPTDLLRKSELTIDQLAFLISILNTNSHELENLGGSGLFLSACRREHNCFPNCSFTTYDDTLWMTAIRPIQKGDALSIDYGNFFYRPVEERRTTLLESYGFLCSCDACLKLPDRTRAFKCVAKGCTEGIVCPFPKSDPLQSQNPDEKDLELVWKCRTCSTT